MKLVSSIPVITRIQDWFEKIIQTLIALLLALMVLIVFANVIARYFLQFSLAWSEEISRFMLIWLTFLGAVLAYNKNEHLGLDIILNVTPVKVASLIKVLVNIILIVVLALLFKGGLDLTANTLDSGWTSPAANVSYGFVYTIVPFSFGSFLYFGTIKLIDSIIDSIHIFKGVN